MHAYCALGVQLHSVEIQWILFLSIGGVVGVLVIKPCHSGPLILGNYRVTGCTYSSPLRNSCQWLHFHEQPLGTAVCHQKKHSFMIKPFRSSQICSWHTTGGACSTMCSSVCRWARRAMLTSRTTPRPEMSVDVRS